MAVSRRYRGLGNDAESFHHGETILTSLLPFSCKNTLYVTALNVHETLLKCPLRLALAKLSLQSDGLRSFYSWNIDPCMLLNLSFGDVLPHCSSDMCTVWITCIIRDGRKRKEVLYFVRWLINEGITLDVYQLGASFIICFDIFSNKRAQRQCLFHLHISKFFFMSPS
jgi:hypothetical protein